MTCVACGGQRLHSMYLVLERAELARCVRCGHAVSVRVRSRRDHRSYGADSDALSRYEDTYLPARARTYARGLEALGRPGHLLDVGANFGHFLAQAASAGWTVHGVELSSGARAAALPDVAGRMHREIGDVAGSAPFDAITMWDVLEHVDDPSPLLRRLAGLLADEGTIVIRVPDARALTAFTGLRAQLHLTLCHPTNPEEHPHHYTPSSLEAMGASCELSLERVLESLDDERVVSARNRFDHRARAMLHRAAVGVPYEFTATLRRAA